MLYGIDDKIADLFKGLFPDIYEWIVKPFADLKTFPSLIYGKDGEDHLAFGTFTLEEMQNIYQPGMNAFVIIAVTGFLIAIIMAGMKISSAGINPSNRTYVIEFFKDLAIVAILFWNLSNLYTLIFGLNYTIVELFASVKEDSLAEMAYKLEPGDDILGLIIINLCLLGLLIWGNFYYMMRKLTLMMLLIIGPVMLMLYLIPQTKGITVGWLKELIGTVFVQSVHAALFWMVSLMSVTTTGLESVILYIIFIPTAEAIRSLFGLGGQMHSNLSKAGAMFGMSALAGMYGSIKGAVGDKSVMGALKGAYDGVKNGSQKDGSTNDEDTKSTVGSNTGTDSGTTSLSEKMLKAGEITSKMGKATFGMAGAVAGSVMGPSGSIMGSTMGFVAGGVAGGIAGRTGMAGLQLAGNRLANGGKGFKDGFNNTRNADALADEKLANELASPEFESWASANKEDFMKNMKEKFPDAHEQAIEGMWNKEKSQKHGEYLAKARETVANIRKNDGSYATAESLANATTDKLTNAWAKNNKAQFDKDYDAQHPVTQDMSDEEIVKRHAAKQQAWENVVDGKRAQFSAMANGTAEKMSNGINMGQAFVNKEEYAKAIAEKALANDKADFKTNFLNNNPNATSQEIDIAFEEQSGGQRMYLQQAKDAIRNVKPQQLYSGKDVNTPYLASQLATMKTQQDGGNFQQNLKDVTEQMPVHIPLDKGVIQNTAVRGAAALGSGVVSGVFATTGLKEIGTFAKDTKLGKVAMAGVQGASLGFKQGLVEPSGNIITKIGNPIVSSVVGAQTQAKVAMDQQHIPENAIGKQAGFRNAISYSSGIVGGVRGYQSGSRTAMKINPYNNAVNQQIAEVSDIQHIAQKVDLGNGQMEIAKGAVQLVTTNNQSYVQVRDVTGQTRVVSRLGTGDSALKKGQSVFQDLTVQDGVLMQDSNPYQFDSSGGKIETNRRINVNPSRLLANNNTSKTPRVVQEIQAFNQQVDSGNFTADQVIDQTKNIRMVVTKERSYMVGTDNQGREMRISPYGAGDARLGREETVQVNCSVRNKRIVKESVTENSRPDYLTTLDPSDLLPPRPNKRNQRRREFEPSRHRSIGGM
ncbi:hypothetical protein [Bacillus sp. AFS040349]|uniref:hypothetical protein n=1 Tax=Bacillus sp. AFS040349 TaxID=2033502 RepID=UPI000BFDA3C3|nr:hypothetical protein [Bacillus sp. AFS040349]PGT80578.1 hypothetical protein COD11_20930 [Bacillus sp. AFS040349]